MDENKQGQADDLQIESFADTVELNNIADKIDVPPALDDASNFTWGYLFGTPPVELQGEENSPAPVQEDNSLPLDGLKVPNEKLAIATIVEGSANPKKNELLPPLAKELLSVFPSLLSAEEDTEKLTYTLEKPQEPYQFPVPVLAEDAGFVLTDLPPAEENTVILADISAEPQDEVQPPAPVQEADVSAEPLDEVQPPAPVLEADFPLSGNLFDEYIEDNVTEPLAEDSPALPLGEKPPLPASVTPKTQTFPSVPCDAENKPSTQPKQKKASVGKKIFSVSLRSVFTLFKTALLLLFIPLIVYVNFTIDCSGMFHSDDFEEAAVQKLMQGENLDNYDNLNERKINSLFILSQEEPLDLAALGSSRILQMSAETAATTSFFNFGVSGGDFEDMVGTFYQMELANMLPQNLVLGIDPWLLNPDKDASSPRSDKELYKEFLTLRLGIPTEYTPYNPLEPFDIEDVDKAPLFDLAYFQSNVQFWMQNPTYSRVNPATVQNLEINNNNVKTFDGSVMYSQEFRDVSPEDAQSKAQAMTASFPRMDNFAQLDTERCDLFSLFVDYVQSKGVNVIFVLAPFHPLVYSYITAYKSLFTGFLQTEPWFAEFAQQRDIPLYGSFNPYVAECYREDFYDGWHMHREALTRMFPGVGSVLQSQANDEAGSSWFVDGERISEKRAMAAIMDQYPAPSEYSLTAAGSVTISNTDCYVYERHKTDESPAPLIDRFAVSKDEGLVYRYEASAGGWIVDARF